MESGCVAATASGAKSADPEVSRELDLARLKGLRSTQRGKVTNLLKNLKTLYTTKTSDADSLAYAIHCLEEAVSVLSSTESDLEAMGECTRVDQYFSDSDELIFKSRRLLSRLDNSDDQSCSSGGSVVPSMHSASLPRLTLPRFTGNFMEWMGFWDQFKAAVHETGIPAIHKFVYLKTCLEGDASHALDEYSVSADNYPRAVAELRGRYGNPSILIGMYSNALLEIPDARPGDLTSFRCVVDKFRSYLRELRSVIDSVSSSEPRPDCEEPTVGSGSHAISSLILSPVLLRKLPSDVVLDWNRRTRSNQKDRFDLEKLLDFVKGELEEREALSTRGVHKPEAIHAREQRPSMKPVYPRRATVMAAAVTSTVAGESQSRSLSPKLDFYGELRSLPDGSRLSFVRMRRLCFNCLRPNHSTRVCQNKLSCRQCGKRHHTLLHSELDVSRHANASSASSCADGVDSSSPRVAAQASLAGPSRRGLLQTAQIWVSNENARVKPVLVRALLDPGSEETYVSARLVRTLRLSPVDRRTFAVESFGGRRSASSVHNRMALTLNSRFSDERFRILAWEVKQMCNVFRPPGFSREDEDFFARLNLADSYGQVDGIEPIDILIGADALPTVLLQEAPIRSPSGFLLSPTIFGWTLMGGCPAPSGASHSLASYVRFCYRISTPEDMWSLESLNIDPKELVEKSYPTPVYLEDENRYQVGLPWKSDVRPVNNKSAAVARLRSVLRLPQEKRDSYEAYLKKLEAERIIEDVPASDSVPACSFYLPHHGVWRNGKLRVVFDGSATSPNGVSLNDALDPGPNLTQHIMSAIVSFRLSRIVITADVSLAFLQVAVQESDRDYLRFVWVREGCQRESRFRRVPFGVTSSPFLLQHVLHHHLSQCEDALPESVDLIRRGLYVDDISIGCDDQSEVLLRRAEAIEIFNGAGMHLHKWRLGGCPSPCEVEFSSSPGCVLGVLWIPEADVLEMRFSLDGKRISTKRALLSFIARGYDPLGLCLPWTVSLRLRFQKCWEEKMSWDDPLPAALELDCAAIFPPDQTLSLQVPRFVGVPTSIHVFVDASPKAYAACLYFVSCNQRCLVIARSKVAPLNPVLSLPRLELTAALLGVRLYRFFLHGAPQFSGLPVRFWSDSMIVLAWIRSDPKSLKVFVRNRVAEIKEKTSVDMWRKVASEENPADLATRGIAFWCLKSSGLWWNGPQFLLSYEHYAAPLDEDADAPAAVLLESRVASVVTRCVQGDGDTAFDLTRFSCLRKAEITLAYVYRFVHNSRRGHVTGPLSCRELRCSFQFFLRQEQNLYYGKEIQALQRGEIVLHTSLHGARLCLRDGVLYGQPRTHEPLLPVLPNRSHLFLLVVRRTHSQLYHQGVSSTCAEIRRQFWVPKLVSRIKQILRGCVPCRRLYGRPFRVCEASLPESRCTPSRPFSHTGLDLCGPFLLSEGRKCWILLFTCSCVRAIHLEVVFSMNVLALENAVRRFNARRGPVMCFLSDNGSSFKALAKALPGFQWNFLPEAAPWWGGFWERLVGSVKRALKASLWNSSLSSDEFTTVVTELEDAINRRPLCSDSDEEEVLTPSHFLRAVSPPALNDHSLESSSQASLEVTLDRRWRHRVTMSNKLWNRWIREYLPQLRQWRRGWSMSREPQPGEIVLVDGSPAPRNMWPLGRIHDLLRGPDGVVRAVQIQMRKGLVTRRPVQKLIPLEVSVPEPTTPPLVDPSSPELPSSPLVPKTSAALVKPGASFRAQSPSLCVPPPIRTTRSGRHIIPTKRYLQD